MDKRTEGRTITETDIVMFSYFTGDWTYLHTDAEMARKSNFGGRVAHGYLTLSVSLGLIVRSGFIDREAFIALRSIERVNFLKPVKIGDTIEVRYSTERVSSNGGTIIARTSARTYNQNNECVMEFEAVHLEREKIER